MVITKAIVTSKLAELKAYCIAEDSRTSSFFTPVETAIDTYFSTATNLNTLLAEVVQFMYFDISRRTTKYENEFPLGLRTDFPAGYYDISECFFQFPELLNMSGADLYAAFVYGMPEAAEGETADGGESQEVPLSNPYLTAWATDIPTEADQDVQRVTALDEWCQDCGNADLVSLLEEQGKVTEKLGVQEIAGIIYNDRNMLAVINARGLSVYVPSYFK